MNDLVQSKNTNTELVAPPSIDGIGPSQMYLMSLNSETSQTTMSSVLDAVAQIFDVQKHEHLDWLSLEVSHVHAVLRVLAKGNEQRRLRAKKDRRYKAKLAPSGINMHLSAIKGVFKAAWMGQLIDLPRYERIKAIKSVPGSRKVKREKPVAKAKIKNTIEYCESLGTKRGARDAVIIATLAGTGMRRSEIASLKLDDFDQDKSKIYVIGKGNKEREVNVPLGVTRCIVEFIKQYRGETPGPLFPRIRRHDYLCLDENSQCMTGQAIYEIVKNRTKEANTGSLRPHQIRHYVGTTLIRNGSDIVTVRDYLGHASITTTQVYIDEDEEQLKKAADSLEL